MYSDDKDALEAFHMAGVDLGHADYRGNTALHVVSLFVKCDVIKQNEPEL